MTKSPEGRQREAFCQREIGRFRGLAVVKRFIQPQRASAAKQISLFTAGSTFERQIKVLDLARGVGSKARSGEGGWGGVDWSELMTGVSSEQSMINTSQPLLG